MFTDLRKAVVLSAFFHTLLCYGGVVLIMFFAPGLWAQKTSYQNVRLVSLHTGHADQRIIRLYSQPALRPGHRAELWRNGRLDQSPLHTHYFLLHYLPRGHHRIQVRITDAQGRLQTSSPVLSLSVF